MDGGEKMIDFSGVKLPFNVTDLLLSSTGLLKIVGSFVVLAMAFYWVQLTIKLIRDIQENKDEWYEHNKNNKFGKFIKKRF